MKKYLLVVCAVMFLATAQAFAQNSESKGIPAVYSRNGPSADLTVREGNRTKRLSFSRRGTDGDSETLVVQDTTTVGGTVVSSVTRQYYKTFIIYGGPDGTMAMIGYYLVSMPPYPEAYDDLLWTRQKLTGPQEADLSRVYLLFNRMIDGVINGELRLTLAEYAAVLNA